MFIFHNHLVVYKYCAEIKNISSRMISGKPTDESRIDPSLRGCNSQW
ncbi:hypothetical protein HSB1_34190 [Halogranum salarium B-1]|uniref:Uncharacterized protein n=1 Tax=Halogranum salarium B-1 TaxID=1210908 RepID=J3EUE4_9EURY|nr:hypothetical protein HSB1_34190 [Halogranum salarium B-1]